MARLFTADQKALLRAPAIRVRVLMTFFLDEGTYRFCDDVFDVSDGVDTYIGANSLASTIEIKSGRDLSAEPITLILDGNRMTQSGIQDPARVLRDILGYLYQQRRVDIRLGFSYPDSQNIQLSVPVAAMKINYARLVDEKINYDTTDTDEPVAKLEIVMDSLAARYTRASWRTRSHDDQLEIDPSDQFFSFVSNAPNNESNLYWGKGSPTSGSSFSIFGGQVIQRSSS